jgi:hypothetical protein
MKIFQTNKIEVRLYKTKAAMRRAIRRIGYNCDFTEAMVIPIIVAYSFKGGKETKIDIAGEMYLHENSSLPVVVHEALHAATTCMRYDKQNINLSNGINYKEELLAYTQTAILQDILKVFFPKTNSDYDLTDIKWWARNSVKKPNK